MKTILVVLGTRPEAIKMCPLVKKLKERREINTLVCVTGQHREMIDEALKAFSVIPDFFLDSFLDEQSLTNLYARILNFVGRVIQHVTPDLVLVHGDTASALASALAAFLCCVPIGHVEAGLRSGDLSSPFPEEMNRVLISQLATLDFAPTDSAQKALLDLGKEKEQIWVTGNTVIDALKETIKRDFYHPLLGTIAGKKVLFLTVHRRENLGEPIRAIFRTVLRIVDYFPDVCVIAPLHKNPGVREAAKEIFGEVDHPRVLLTEPLGVEACHNLMARSTLILTDSGGLQEEAPALGKPVIVLREKTERIEGVKDGGAILCGSDPKRIFKETIRLLSDSAYYSSVARVRYPYGNGGASEKITDVVLRYLVKG